MAKLRFSRARGYAVDPRWRLIPQLVGASLLLTNAVRAEPNDERARRLASDAINTDYLATHFQQAQVKLGQALALCDKDGSCSAKVRSRIHRELGVVYVAGLNDLEGGKQHFRTALALDPSVELDRDLTTPEIQAAFDAVRGEAGAPPDKSGPPAAPDKPTPGEIVHEPPMEQAVLTPVPIYVELPEGVVAAKVTLRYRPFGATAWKSVEMNRRKDGYGGEVPCLDVGSTTGDLEYYIVASDAAGDVAAFSGTAKSPHKVPIKHELSGEPPHLPGKPPPAQCQDVSDCPPGFPGCVSGDKSAEQNQASSDARGPLAKNWVSLGVQEDILFLSSSKSACSGGNEYTCFTGDSPSSYYGGIPYAGSGNEVAGGARLATTRILAGYDRVLGENFAVGTRLGFAFGGGPKAPTGNAFLPVHAELRGTYNFGSDPFHRKGLRPYVHVSGGLAQIDADVSVPAFVDNGGRKGARLNLTAWKKSGTAFVGIGGGLMYAVTPTSGPFLDVRLLEMLGVSGTAISPLIGYAIGF